jgi:hypothetical protein
MKFMSLAITAPLAAVLLCGGGWAQQTPDAQNPPETSAKSAKATAKEKHLTGSLVDVGCMVKALNPENQASPQAEPAPSIPHFAGGGAGLTEPGQGPVPGGGGAGGMQAPVRQNPEPGVQPNSPTAGADETAKMAQANRVDNAVKQCTPSPSAQTLGLATSDGQVVQFDQDGSAKAKEALKNADVQPGKKIKAKVTCTMEDKATVNVASIEIKGKGKRGSAGTANPGS